MNQMKRLFEPIKIGQMELKNRLKLPALGLAYAHDMKVTERLKNFYAERAKGGVALIGVSCTGTRLEAGDILLGIYDDQFIPGLRELVDICHEYNSKAYAQIGAGYAWAFGNGPVEFVSPSGVTASGRVGPPIRLGAPSDATIPRALTINEIHQIVAAYGQAARRARQAGFDAFEFVASTGYLPSQFLSPLSNRRTDEYGGSLENRTRIFVDIINSIKKNAGEDYPLMCRIGSDLMNGGYTIEDTKLIASMLETAGVQCFDAIPGWHEAPLPMMQMSVPQGHWLYIAEELKKTVHAPVAAGTRLTDPLFAEQVIVDGKADLIYMARPLICDPELPNKAKEGRLDDIRPCIACCHCFDLVETPIACAINARAGKEKLYEIKPATKSKRIFIIGGGPAGMESARIAAIRGHKVTLYEKDTKLGGQVLLAALPPHKGEINKLIKYLRNQLKKAGVKVKFGYKTDIKSIIKHEPDEIIIATGASPIIPDIPGVTRKNVFTASSVLTESQPVKNKVIIIGGGMVGCETAEFLAHKGKQVTILEMLERIGNDIGRTNRWVLINRLKQLGIRMETNVTATEITSKGVRGLQGKSSVFFESDSVILAVGVKANTDLVEQLEGKITLHLIGDCVGPQKIAEAIESGVKIACEI